MALCALGEPEFLEDAGDVLLDRALSDDKPVGNTLIGVSFGHQLQHLTLAWRQLGQRIITAMPPHQLADHRRVLAVLTYLQD